MALMLVMVFTKCEQKRMMKLGDRKVLAGYKDSSGNKYIEVLLQRTVDTIQRDSSGVKSKIVRAEIWGAPIFDSARDKLGKAILDSVTKKPKIIIIGYSIIPSDKIFTDISNKDYDSLMKKEGK